LTRVTKITEFFWRLEKDIRINYLFTRIVKLIVVELYCTHTAACIFYYLATTLPESKEGYTWIGSLQLGDYKFSHFREIDLTTRYTTSLYFAIVTMATVGKKLRIGHLIFQHITFATSFSFVSENLNKTICLK
jgi:hyperpolarization activated cyclic nucleotide-gated potassium channel 4